MKQKSFISHLISQMRALVFPDRCALCGCIIRHEAAVCDSCKNTPLLIKGARCFKCGLAQKDCECKSKSNFYDAAAAVFIYDGVVKQGIKYWKYRDAYHSKNYFAQMLAKTVTEAFGEIKFDAVTFVPQTESEKKERGYNQCEILALETAENLKLPLVPTLNKLINTSRQHNISAYKKSGNIFGAFDCIDPEIIKNKTFLLIDDIKTSGATLNECAKMLQLYEAQHVYVAVIAVAKNRKKNLKQ